MNSQKTSALFNTRLLFIVQRQNLRQKVETNNLKYLNDQHTSVKALSSEIGFMDIECNFISFFAKILLEHKY
ncbi:hypothetical protein RN001_001813 [Aquatica leii]|uniref:Uncharacterized protein n=1 Tax=Aquatica leii TaxID=1421715 RepID=A0AAN7SJS9_9COLE|nr:hypothetical protein RN001_001813 [Aquatica leii]